MCLEPSLIIKDPESLLRICIEQLSKPLEDFNLGTPWLDLHLLVIIVIILVVLRFEFRASCMLGRCSTTGNTLQPFVL
jgi:hypothetical protein